MRLKKKLRYGETPWDNLNQDQLLRVVTTMYSALRSCYSVCEMTKGSHNLSPFWGPKGVGGNAIAKAQVALKGVEDEAAFRAFFRYADDFLFPDLDTLKWGICTGGCGSLMKPFKQKCFCGSKMRNMQWKDLVEYKSGGRNAR